MNNNNFDNWFREIKQELLLSEPENIAARAQCCENIINESISQLNTKLGLKQLDRQQLYKCTIDPRVHLQFLLDWPGLRLGSESVKVPRSKREYEKKAKNWLNGRRAPNYGKTLFPQFISESEQYAKKITKYLISDTKKQSVYYKVLIYRILAQFCACSVSLNEQAKKAPFFCKNSIERKGKLKEILQAYAFDHQYIQGFPSCFQEAIDYFENKSNQYFAQLLSECQNQSNFQITDVDADYVQINAHNNDTNNELTFWKNKAQQLQQELDNERQKRIQTEKERDGLQQLLNSLHSTYNINNNQCQYGIIAAPPKQFNMYSNSGGGTAQLQSAQNVQNIQMQNVNGGVYQNKVGQQMAATLLRILQTE